MSDRVWHKGPPPFTGWWNASEDKDDVIWRWWDGKRWSELAIPYFTADTAAYQAKRPHWRQDRIRWSDYWPENARVPRLDPTGGHWTFNVDGVRPENLPTWIDAFFGDGDQVTHIHRDAFTWDLSGGSLDILAWRPAA